MKRGIKNEQAILPITAQTLSDPAWVDKIPYRSMFPVVPTTFSENGELDLESQLRCVDFRIDAGANGAMTGGIIACEAPRRAYPTMPSETRQGLLAAARRLDPLVLRMPSMGSAR